MKNEKCFNSSTFYFSRDKDFYRKHRNYLRKSRVKKGSVPVCEKSIEKGYFPEECIIDLNSYESGEVLEIMTIISILNPDSAFTFVNSEEKINTQVPVSEPESNVSKAIQDRVAEYIKHSNLDLSEISLMFGFRNIRNFKRYFKRITNQSIRTFRKEYARFIRYNRISLCEKGFDNMLLPELFK